MREVARLGLLLSVLAPALPAQRETVHRLVAADAARLLHHADAVVRGEAAMVLGGARDPENDAALVALARDPEPAARLRALLALGFQDSAGVVPVLEAELADAGNRTEPAGIAAAFALGALQPDRAPVVTAQLLSSFLQSSLKRQRDVLHALLCSMRRHAQDSQVVALRRLFLEEATRDDEVRARLLVLLLGIQDALDSRQLRRVLDRGSDTERRAMVAWLGANECAQDADLIAPIERLATQSQDPQLRTAALAMLTRVRHLPALELAAKALRSECPAEAAQGVRSALAIGGAGMRAALERELSSTTDPARQAAMLRAYAAPPSAELVAFCARLAMDGKRPAELRIAAATQLARSDAPRAAPMLRTLFRETTRSESLLELAGALASDGGPRLTLDRLLPGPPDLRQNVARWRALVATGHPEAMRQVLTVLGSRSASAADLAEALRTWRFAMGLFAPLDPHELLPDPLPLLFGT